MSNQFSSDQDILEALQSREAVLVNAALKHLYLNGKLFGAVKQQIVRLGGSSAETRDVLNMALLEFDKKVENNQYDPAQSSIITYIVAIARQMFYTRQRSEKRRTALHNRAMTDELKSATVNPERQAHINSRDELLEVVLKSIGEKCRQLLKLYSLDFSMAEIAAQLQYKNADSAKMAVADCRKKSFNFLKQRPELTAALLEI